MEVRLACPTEVRRIAEIHVRSWQAAYKGLLPQDYLDALDPADGLGRREQAFAVIDWNRGGILVAADGDELWGFVNVGPTRDDDADESQIGEVRAIYLAPDAWGKGFGRELMAAALERLARAGFAEATLWVLDTNVRARKFYEAAGFQPDGSAQCDDTRGFRLCEIRYRRILP
jgi:GNAT superfamily N-acetyltransferase